MRNALPHLGTHAQKVQVLVWASALFISVANALAIVPRYRDWGGEVTAPGMPDWQVRLTVDLTLAIAGLVLLALGLRRGRTSVLVLTIVVGLVPLWIQVGSYVAATMLGMRRGLAALPIVIGAAVVGLSDFWLPLSEFELLTSAGDAGRQYVAVASPYLICVLLGMILQSREDLLRSSEHEARLARATQDARVAQGRAEERARISREMHDSLAHRLSLVSLHAGALTSRSDLDPTAVRGIATTIQTVAADAGSELRQILAVLHDDGTGDGSRAGWPEVEQVIAQERGAGQDLEVTVADHWCAVFEAADAAARHGVLRTVEEALTNARRHGAGGPVSLIFEVEDSGELVVECLNSRRPGAGGGAQSAPGHGLGLPDLGERLRLLGGSLSVSRLPETFAVRALLPADGARHHYDQGGEHAS